MHECPCIAGDPRFMPPAEKPSRHGSERATHDPRAPTYQRPRLPAVACSCHGLIPLLRQVLMTPNTKPFAECSHIRHRFMLNPPPQCDPHLRSLLSRPFSSCPCPCQRPAGICACIPGRIRNRGIPPLARQTWLSPVSRCVAPAIRSPGIRARWPRGEMGIVDGIPVPLHGHVTRPPLPWRITYPRSHAMRH